MDLTGKQRRYLRALAHHLEPVVIVGVAGVSDAITAKVDEELDHHELIKVKVSKDAPEDVKTSGEAIARRTRAHLAQTIGRIAVLYRRRAKKPAIKLPVDPEA